MLYKEFGSRLLSYLALYEKGLKKQANSDMKETAAWLRGLPDAEQDSILHQFLTEYCDAALWEQLHQRGNGDMPYALREYILSWLTPRCEAKYMPELRWYYELYRNHPTGIRYAVKYLEDAYASPECDQKTVDLLFDSFVDELGWGAHHFPDGCILEQAVIENCMQQCEAILAAHAVSEYPAYRFEYYKRLYACYEQYKADGKIKSFDAYLKEADMDSYYAKAFPPRR